MWVEVTVKKNDYWNHSTGILWRRLGRVEVTVKKNDYWNFRVIGEDVLYLVEVTVKKNDYYDWVVMRSRKNERQFILTKEPRAPASGNN